MFVELVLQAMMQAAPSLHRPRAQSSSSPKVMHISSALDRNLFEHTPRCKLPLEPPCPSLAGLWQRGFLLESPIRPGQKPNLLQINEHIGNVRAKRNLRPTFWDTCVRARLFQLPHEVIREEWCRCLAFFPR